MKTVLIRRLSFSPSVVQPPQDQRGATRLGVFYFCMPNDNVSLVPFLNSSVLLNVGIGRRFEDKDAPTMEVWRKGRTAAYGTTALRQCGERYRRGGN